MRIIGFCFVQSGYSSNPQGLAGIAIDFTENAAGRRPKQVKLSVYDHQETPIKGQG